uniref:DNA gyrase subunit B n=1 Tax=Rhizophora mucronata TaxID=61149 RepID=A0A2P2LWS8_RHIMU
MLVFHLFTRLRGEGKYTIAMMIQN